MEKDAKKRIRRVAKSVFRPLIFRIDLRFRLFRSLLCSVLFFDKAISQNFQLIKIIPQNEQRRQIHNGVDNCHGYRHRKPNFRNGEK